MSNGDDNVERQTDRPLVLTVNGGSSSIKFAVFELNALSPAPSRRLSGEIQRIAQPGTQLIAKSNGDEREDVRPVDATNFDHAAKTLIDYIRERLGAVPIQAIGHRIVHGGINLFRHQLITPELIGELRKVQPLDLSHLPIEISLIEAFGKAFPNLPQVACFDTAFHHEMPTVARLLPIPRRYLDAGVRRFGFHGLSYTYLMNRLAEVAGADAANGRVILAHLGSGASMAAVHHRKPIDTTMAFTPTAGLMMGTRPGDLDPGLLVYMMRQEHLTIDQADDLVSHQCGLKGVSNISSDTRDLLKARATDSRAAEAIDLFCYQAKKFIGSLTAALGGLDTLIFAGGIGEHSPELRESICAGLEYLGITLDPNANADNRDVISAASGRVIVRVIPTDEEIVIAEATGAIVLS